MITKFNWSISAIVLLFLVVSCALGQQNHENEFKTSKVYPAITCKSDSNISYALFLPPAYEKGKPCPVLVLFDPHGDGLLPVTLFSAEAAKNGFILAGSNNSKNGMPIEQTTEICRKLLAELNERFTLEKKAVFLGGFSGGSRVAGASAISLEGIAGVVGCGAGLPNSGKNPVRPFSYLAVTGNRDFNFTEMKRLDESLEAAGFQHHLIVFDGTHQWPPKEVIPEIFTWLTFDAMRQKAIPTERTRINNFIEKYDKTANDLAAAENFPQQLEVYRKMTHYLSGLTDVAPLQAEIEKLSHRAEVITFNKSEEQLITREQELQQKYSPQITLQNTEWWEKETSHLWAMTKKTDSPEMNLVYSRLLGFLSLNCYMYSTGALKQGNLPAAAKFIEIYRLVDPTNTEHRYLAAKVAALNHDQEAVFVALKKAFDLGFMDINRLQSDTDFKPYQQDERYKKIISGK